MAKDNINRNFIQKRLFNAGKREIAADLRDYDPDIRDRRDRRRVARKVAHVVANEAADPIDVRRAGASRIVRRTGGALALGVGIGVLGHAANQAFENSPSFQRSKNSGAPAPAEESGGDNSLHPDPTQAVQEVKGNEPPVDPQAP